MQSAIEPSRNLLFKRSPFQLFIRLAVNPSNQTSIYPTSHLFTWPSIDSAVSSHHTFIQPPSIYPSIDPSNQLSIHVAIRPSNQQSIHLDIHRSSHSSILPSANPVNQLSIYHYRLPSFLSSIQSSNDPPISAIHQSSCRLSTHPAKHPILSSLI